MSLFGLVSENGRTQVRPCSWGTTEGTTRSAASLRKAIITWENDERFICFRHGLQGSERCRTCDEERWAWEAENVCQECGGDGWDLIADVPCAVCQETGYKDPERAAAAKEAGRTASDYMKERWS